MPFAETLDAEAESPKRKRSRRLEAKERARQAALIERFKDDEKSCDDSWSKWKDEAQEAERYYDGHQYESADADKLKKQKRAGLTYNRIAKRVDLVDGTEIYHRQKVIFLPKQPNREGATGTSDLATDAVDWVIENCKGMHERSRVWHDSNVRGVGCMSLYMDHEEDPRGRILMKRVDSYELKWDPNAREMNLEDARWIRRASFWHLDDIKARFGEEKANKLKGGESKDPNAIPSVSPGDDSNEGSTRVVNHGPNIFAEGAQDVTPARGEKPPKGMVKVCEVQWFEREPCMLVIDDGSLPLSEMMSDDPPAPADIAPQTNPRLIETPPDPAAMAGAMPPMDPAAMGQMLPPPSAEQMPGAAPPAPPMDGSMPPPAAPPGAPPSPDMGMAPESPSPGAAPPGAGDAQGGPGAPPAPPAEEPAPEEPVEKILSLAIEEWEELALALEQTGLPLPPAVESERRVYKQAFYSDDVLLEDGDMWINGFSYLFLTHKYDADEKIWYGMVRNLLDPQRGANKFFSQGVDVWSRGAKGALLMERDAAADPNSLPDIWAGPSPIVLMNAGAVTEKRYEIVPPPDFPPAAAQMTQFALEALNDIGPSEAMTGQMEAGAGQPGVSVQKAQVQGMTTLAPNFDALTRFRYTEAKTIIKMVREFLLDGRLIRIGGPHNSRFEKLLAEKFSEDYDLVIDEVPRDPNARRQVWDQLGPLLPIAFRSGRIPHAWKDFSPFPASVIEEWKKQEDQEAQAPPPPDLKTDPRWIESQIAIEMANAELKKAQATLAIARAQTLIRESGVATIETLSDIKRENERLKHEQALGIRDQAHQEDKDTLDSLTAVRRDRQPASPGVKGTP